MPVSSRWCARLLCGAALVGAGPARAAEHGVVFAGGMASKAPSYYLGGAVALPGATLGHGLAVRAVLAANDYDYAGGAGRVKARERSATVSAVYQLSGAWGYANLAGGATYRDTRLRPDDPGNGNRGRKWDGVAGGDGALLAGRWRFGGLGSYQVNLHEHYLRLDGTFAVVPVLRLGGEFVTQGNPAYDRRLYGGVAAVPAGKWELRLSGGALRQRLMNGSYAALSVARIF